MGGNAGSDPGLAERLADGRLSEFTIRDLLSMGCTPDEIALGDSEPADGETVIEASEWADVEGDPTAAPGGD